MKPLIVFSDVTIDGFMAGLDNDLDFMVDDPQLEDELTGMSCAACWGSKVRASSPSSRQNPDFKATLGVVARYHDCTLKEAAPPSDDLYYLLLKRRPSLYTGSLLYCHGRYCSVRTARGFAGSQLPRGPPEAGIRDRN